MTGLPERIGRYAVVRALGAGGMGEVLLGYSPAGSPVAIKLIRADRIDPQTRQRFEREALIARTVIGTDRVARFLDADPYADRPWLAMEYVPGRTLLDLVDAEGPLPAGLVASAGALLAEGLAAVHAVHLLHRDLKPQNIILGESGPVIIDFGLAALTDSSALSLTGVGAIVGTVRCMPPEQATGQRDLTEAADVYGLGTVLLYAATGHYPYDGGRWEAIAARVANRELPPDLSGLPEALTPLVGSMLAHEPADRPSLAGVGDACAAVLAGLGLTPAQARRALISRTHTADDPAEAERLTPSLEDRLHEIEAALAADPEPDSPLDRGPAPAPVAPAPEGPAPGTPTPGTPAPVAPAPEGPVPDIPPLEGPARPVPARQAAAERVAEELRSAYAPQSAL